MDTMPRMLAILLFTGLSFACVSETPGTDSESSEYRYAAPEQADDGWETRDLRNTGMRVEPPEDAIGRIQSGVIPNIQSLLIAKDGRLVVEEYFGPNRDNLQRVYSVTKSVTSMLVGIAIDNGLIESVDEPVYTFFPEYEALEDSSQGRIALKHLLTMSAGLKWNEPWWSSGDRKSDLRRFYSARDPIRFVLKRPVVNRPGSNFNYNTALTDVLGVILRKATGTRVEDFSDRYLFSKLGIDRTRWEQLGFEETNTGGGLWLRSRDMAKLGQLMLNEGVWNEERVVSKEWIDESTQTYFSGAPWMEGYGYLWWVNGYPVGQRSFHAYFAWGWGGQHIFVIPSIQLVVVITGKNFEGTDPAEDLLLDSILPAALGLRDRGAAETLRKFSHRVTHRSNGSPGR